MTRQLILRSSTLSSDTGSGSAIRLHPRHSYLADHMEIPACLDTFSTVWSHIPWRGCLQEFLTASFVSQVSLFLLKTRSRWTRVACKTAKFPLWHKIDPFRLLVLIPNRSKGMDGNVKRKPSRPYWCLPNGLIAPEEECALTFGREYQRGNQNRHENSSEVRLRARGTNPFWLWGLERAPQGCRKGRRVTPVEWAWQGSTSGMQPRHKWLCTLYRFKNTYI